MRRTDKSSLSASTTRLVLGAVTALLLGCGSPPPSKAPVSTGSSSLSSASGPLSPTPGATQSGVASYYADSLAGHPTASGEPYDPKDFTAAEVDRHTLEYAEKAPRVERPYSGVHLTNPEGKTFAELSRDLKIGETTAMDAHARAIGRLKHRLQGPPRARLVRLVSAQE